MKSAILMGKGKLACQIADWFLASVDYDLELVIPVMPEPTWTESLAKWCRSHAVRYVKSGDYRDIPQVTDASWTVDLGMSIFYDKILPGWFIDKSNRLLNLHNGPLPRYRGVNPINWALKNEENMHGVTLHEITRGIDDGPIVAQVTFSTYPKFDEVIDVYNRALEYGYQLFAQTMPLLDMIQARPQDESLALHYSQKDFEQLGNRRNFTRAQS